MFHLNYKTMAKKAAVLAVNPVNGMGLFQYLEGFFENGIGYKVYAAADSKEIKTNSGLALIVDDVISNLKGREAEFDAVVFACGDAVPKLSENMDKQYNKDMMDVLGNFAKAGKLLIGHCAAGMLFDMLGIADGKRIAVHPYAKAAIKNADATDEKFEIDGNIYTAQTENSMWMMMPEVIKALK